MIERKNSLQQAAGSEHETARRRGAGPRRRYGAGARRREGVRARSRSARTGAVGNLEYGAAYPPVPDSARVTSAVNAAVSFDSRPAN